MFDELDRNTDFFNTCEDIRNDAEGYISNCDIAIRGLYSPAKSFYVTKIECVNILTSLGVSKNKAKCARNYDIRMLFKELRSKHKNCNFNEIVEMILESPAPRFYMSESRAVIVYYELLNQ